MVKKNCKLNNRHKLDWNELRQYENIWHHMWRERNITGPQLHFECVMTLLEANGYKVVLDHESDVSTHSSVPKWLQSLNQKQEKS